MPSKGLSAEEARAKSTAWALTYGDLVTLLLSFFVMILAITNDAEKQIDHIINVLLNETYRETKSVLETSYLSVERVTKGIKISLSSGDLFVSGDAEIKSVVYPLIQQIAGIIKLSKMMRVEEDARLVDFKEALRNTNRELNIEIRCEGHTDNIPLPANAKYKDNWELSTARALNIVRLLSQHSGIPQEKFSALGYGEFKPIEINNTAQNRAKNRRVVIYLDAFISKIE